MLCIQLKGKIHNKDVTGILHTFFETQRPSGLPYLIKIY